MQAAALLGDDTGLSESESDAEKHLALAVRPLRRPMAGVPQAYVVQVSVGTAGSGYVTPVPLKGLPACSKLEGLKQD